MPTDYNNIPEYKRALQSQLRSHLETVGYNALKRIDQGFARGETPTGESWAPLAPSTIRGKGHSRVLIDRGQLRDSFNASVQRDGETYRLTVFSRDENLKFHEFGTETMPKRPVMEPLTRWLEKDELSDRMEAAIIEAEEDAGVSGTPL